MTSRFAAALLVLMALDAVAADSTRPVERADHFIEMPPVPALILNDHESPRLISGFEFKRI